MTTWSIIGRKFFHAPVPGDWELMQVGTTVVACCFLPYCQIVRGNVIVDFFMDSAPARLKAFCDFLGSLMFVAVAALITWRLVHGGLDMHRYHQRLTTIEFEHWWAFTVIVPLIGFLVVIVVYTLFRDLINIATGDVAGDGRLSDH